MMRIQGNRWFRIAGVMSLVLLPSVGSGAEGGGAAGVVGETVELPLFEVIDTPELPRPEDWLHAAVPGFEVLSSLSARETSRFLRDFLLLRSAIDVIMPGAQDTQAREPSVLILCGRGGDFFRFVPPGQGADTFRVESLFFEEGARRAIIVNNALSGLEIDPAGVSAEDTSGPDADAVDQDEPSGGGPGDTGSGTLEADPYRAFYSAYFRQILRRHAGGRSPEWFEEGMVELLAAIDFSQKTITLGRVGDGMGAPRSGDFNRILANRTLMPMEAFFSHLPRSADRLWSAQSYAFVHMCLYGRGGRYQSGFAKLVARAAMAPVSETMVIECLGLDFKALGMEMRGYIDAVDQTYTQMRAGRGHALPEPAVVEVREASDAEGGRLVGEVLALAGRADEARLVLIAPLKRGAKDPRLDAEVGLWAWRAGDASRARRYLERATTAHVDRSEAYLRLAELRLSGLRPADPAAGFSIRDLAPVIVPLESACRHAPPSPAVFSMLAAVWLRCAETPPAGAVGLVNAGVMRFPRDPALVVRAAELNLRHGSAEEARELVRFGLEHLRQKEARAALEDIQRRLPAIPATDAPPQLR